VIGLDLTEAMRDKLRAIAAAAGAANLEVLAGNAEAIPLPEASVDVVSSNGVLNLVPDKPRAIREIARVLRDGGRLQIADVVVRTLPSEACRAHPELWAECVVGATTVESYVAGFEAAGLCDVEMLSQSDYFAGSSSAETRRVAASFGGHSIVLRARKP
jgi:ubiquinone/menaquinone biosynthesis C-methylase UbiE